MANLFDPEKVNENDQSYSNLSTPDHEYLARSGRPESARVRALHENWFAEYPQEHQSELRRRVQSGGHQFESAMFELMLHAAFLRLGATAEVHPRIDGATNRTPDFLVTLPSGFQFYLEAVVTQGYTTEEAGSQKRINDLMDSINRRFVSRQYFWEVTIEHCGSKTLGAADLENALDQHMKTLDHSTVKAECDAGKYAEYDFQYQRDDWTLRFTPIPKNPEAFEKDQKAIGIVGTGTFEHCKDDADLKSSILAKAKHHRDLPKPYVVAVNALRYSVSELDLLDALYGKQAMEFTELADGTMTYREVRQPNGVWFGPSQNSNLIAVIGASRYTPWSVQGSSLTVFENPYIVFPEGGRLETLKGFSAGEGGQFVKREGRTLGELFSLGPDWP